MSEEKRSAEELYRVHFGTLAAPDSSCHAKVTALGYFRAQFSAVDWESPAYFDHHATIDLLIGLARDDQVASLLRTGAVGALADLVRTSYPGECAPVSCAAVAKGVMSLFWRGISTAATDELRHVCVLGARRVFDGCTTCRSEADDKPVLEAVATKLVAGSFASLKSTRGALACLERGFTVCFGRLCWDAVFLRLLLAAAVTAVRRFQEDCFVIEHVMKLLRSIPSMHVRNVEVLDQVGLMDIILRAVDTSTSHSVCRAGLGMLHKLMIQRIDTANGVLVEIYTPGDCLDRTTAAPGFVRVVGKCLSAMGDDIRREAATIVEHMINGTDAHIDLILREPSVIYHYLKYRAGTIANYIDSPAEHSDWDKLARIFESLVRNPRPQLLANLLGSGVMRFFVEFAAKHSTCAPVSTRLGGVLYPILALHKEFAGMIEKAGLGNLIRLPRRNSVGSADYVIADEDAIGI